MLLACTSSHESPRDSPATPANCPGPDTVRGVDVSHWQGSVDWARVKGAGIGFVFAMVFGHAPIIFPAVARVKVPYHPAMYLPLILLHVSLAVRLAGGLQADFALRQTGGLLNALALLAFIIVMLASVLSGKTRSR